MFFFQEVALAIGPFSITAEREAVVDYTQAFMEDGVGIIMSKPSPQADDMVRIFLPFHQYVWFAICSSVILVGKYELLLAPVAIFVIPGVIMDDSNH